MLIKEEIEKIEREREIEKLREKTKSDLSSNNWMDLQLDSKPASPDISEREKLLKRMRDQIELEAKVNTLFNLNLKTYISINLKYNLGS